MPDYSRSTTIDADPDELFQYLSKVENLPDYFSGVKEAHSATGDEVHVTAPAEVTGGEGDAEGQVEGNAWFSIDADRRALSWGAQGPHDYKGELSVSEDGGGARVRLSLHTEHDAADAINQGIDETLANIERLVAARPPLQS